MLRLRSLAVLLAGLALSCSAATSNQDDGDDGAGPGDDAGGNGTGGQHSILCPTCRGSTAIGCDNDETDCTAQGLTCIVGTGCGQCRAGTPVCVGNEIHTCGSDGTPGDLQSTCNLSDGVACQNGQCVSACDVAAGEPSNVGCLFWAVDLENEPQEKLVISNTDASAAPWGLALANTGEADASVVIERNMAAPGEMPNLQQVASFTVPAGSLVGQVMPTLEVDGSADDNPGDPMAPGTAITAHAFRVTSSLPIVVYQFNTVTNSFSNDASLLLPQPALGTEYRALTYPPANPIEAPLPGGGAGSHVYITVVGTQDDTQVTITPTYTTRGNGSIPEGGPDTPVTVTVNAFDVFNLEAKGFPTFTDITSGKPPPDLSGSAIVATKPVAVFVGTETSIAPVDSNTPEPPDFDQMNGNCCTDHLEDQLFPVTSVGKSFLVTRSAVRSSGGYAEPDILRFVGVAEAADVTTSLPAPFDHFTLNPGEMRETWTRESITVEATAPVEVAQILVSQGYCSGNVLGDPSLTIYPPAEQFRSQYIFLVPTSWDQTDVVIAAPKGTNVQVDGEDWSGCGAEGTALSLNGVDYDVRTCPVDAGIHKATGDQAFSIVAYGYGSAGSYAHVGGADVRPIYAPPPLH